MDEWQPITTVPMDGNTRILLGNYYLDDCNGYAGEYRWIWIASGIYDTDGSFFVDWFDENYLSKYMHGYHTPTHWIPLPKLPKQD